MSRVMLDTVQPISRGLCFKVIKHVKDPCCLVRRHNYYRIGCEAAACVKESAKKLDANDAKDKEDEEAEQ